MPAQTIGEEIEKAIDNNKNQQNIMQHIMTWTEFYVKITSYSQEINIFPGL